jgi:acetoin utilization deacetylase AcuC-like enzyme
VATAFVTHPDYRLHDTGVFHPERPARLQVIQAAVEHQKTLPGSPFARLIPMQPGPADLSWLTAVHDPRYVEAVPGWCHYGYQHLPTGDTAICPASYDVALLAAGAGLAAVDAVMEGRVRNAFCAVRPPGHHAESGRGMGFCIFNNAAVAARYAQRKYHLSRIFIIDWDVHHGNGTQQIFEEDPTVFYASVHQWPHYPYTGMAWETGVDAGAGFTMNLPVPAGADDAVYLDLFKERIIPAAKAFQPDMMVLSAGFDAHQDDPLSGTMVTEAGFDGMMRLVMELAQTMCSGRVVSILEGGYDLDALARCVTGHLGVLAEYGENGG